MTTMNQPDVELAFRAGSTRISSFSASISSPNHCPKVLIQVIIPDHHWKFVYKVPTNSLVRELLRRVFSSCHLDLFEYANYGLYMPPTGTQKGKFLQEERILSEYPQLLCSPADDLEDLHSPPFIDEDDEEQMNRLGNAASLKLIRKCRYVDGLPMTYTKFKHVNSKSNRKQLLLALQSYNMERIEQLLSRGLDPNFQYKATGDTPLCFAAQQWHSRELILKLVEHGAHLEFRDSDTLTPLHRAAIVGNFEAVKALLDLGQNPNVRDARDLTPLYHAVSQDVPTRCITQLLYDHAILGVMDDKNRQEIHQACLFDRPQHLEQLIIYGADLDAQTANLDTPLHICALNNHEACLRLLLRHGASRCLLNASGQTASEVAMLTGLNRLAEIIDTFTDDQIAPITKPPVYNQDRKPSVIGPRAAFDTARDREVDDSDTYREDGATPTQPGSRHLDRVPTLTSHDTVAEPTLRSCTHPVIPVTVASSRLASSTSSRDQSRSSYPCPNDQIEPRVVTLQRGNTGFGFQIRGRRGDSLDSSTSSQAVANQYIDRIIPGSPAAQANLSPGDFILEVNGRDVTRASHYELTDRIVQSGSEVTLTVLPRHNWISSVRRTGLHREHSRILMADRRHTSCHRTPSMATAQDSRSLSQEHISSSTKLDRFSSARYAGALSIHNDLPSGSVDVARQQSLPPVQVPSQSTVAIYREIPIRPKQTGSMERQRSTSSKESCSLLSHDSKPGVLLSGSESSSFSSTESVTSTSSTTDSSIVSKPCILIVHGDSNPSARPSVNHTQSKSSGDRQSKKPISLSRADPLPLADRWPGVSHL